jgi:hypothetical protein
VQVHSLRQRQALYALITTLKKRSFYISGGLVTFGNITVTDGSYIELGDPSTGGDQGTCTIGAAAAVTVQGSGKLIAVEGTVTS